ncbi:four helix bundle protein [Candidatus Gottesmanbacteria bacterium]|nr:four helix bundle protein [Candidatus Gottesmanbacteria bacterium]
MPNPKYDIYPRIFNFIVRVINLTKEIPKSEQNSIIISQLLRSVTSMGANSEEADGVSTKKDFIYCFTTVRKEGKETAFWLRLIAETNPQLKNRMLDLIKEVDEIVAIISKVITKSRN